MDIFTVTTQEILERISRHCPESLSIYLQCINRADLDGSVLFTKELVEEEMSEDWPKFKSNLKKLAKENLLEWRTNQDKTITVTLANIEVD